MFNKILIANRGEIAVRIIRTCKTLGVKSVAVFSDVDSRSLHVREADEAVYLGPAPSESSYLVKEKIIAAALETGCQAIHPGYGFLSENADMARMTQEAGLIFIGPPPAVITALGDKITAKKVAEKAGVPVVPGHTQPISDPEEAKCIAATIGYPILLKPAAGGGGRGMRIVHSPDEFAPALRAGQEETRKAFGDDRLFMERFIVNPRHIEIQIMADNFGNVISLGERECSIQRRYQKVIEESPSLALSPEQRQNMGERACSLAREAGYTNAGTVEFILDATGDFYFLEMNTRLQVEHPVTELVNSLDLVELQLRVAAGEPLPIKQEDVNLRGWAIEARICAEDSGSNFLPSTGLITRYAPPRGKNVRVDSGVTAGSRVNVYYDSMLAKVICYGETREKARISLIHALNRYHIEGVLTNIDFCNAILNHQAFIDGELNTSFIENHFDNGRCLVQPAKETIDLMVIASTLVYHSRQNLVIKSAQPLAAKLGTSHRPQYQHVFMVKSEDHLCTATIIDAGDGRNWSVTIDGKPYEVITPEFEFYRRRIKLLINDQNQYFRQQYDGNFIKTAFRGINRTFEVYSTREWELAQYMPEKVEKSGENILLSPMPGLVVDIKVQPGERVYKGQDLVVIESMKMESGVSSPCNGVVEQISIVVGQAVETNDVMVTFKP